MYKGLQSLSFILVHVSEPNLKRRYLCRCSYFFQIQRNVQSLVPTAQHNAQSYSTEGRPRASTQTSSSRDVMRRYEGDDVTLAVIQGLASLTSRTGTLVVIVGGLVRV